MRLCYGFNKTPTEIMNLTFAQFYLLEDELAEVVKEFRGSDG